MPEAEGFGGFVEGRCAKFDAAGIGLPGLTPGIHLQSLLIAYFAGVDSERGITWHLADPPALRQCLMAYPSEQTLDPRRTDGRDG